MTRSGDVLPPGVRALLGSTNDPSTTKAVAAEAGVVVSDRTRPHRRRPARFPDAITTLTTTAGRTRLLVVGGADNLVVDGRRLVDSPVSRRTTDPER
ncbi:hypothetical protein ABGB17_29715 [Sphaerisporangium sp. B11E5]|uniref:hypothetical protein n=1 Tax=Sphaerisporangium sp. B11E5 TaxID=3153563 RepID=UPI00325D5447